MHTVQPARHHLIWSPAPSQNGHAQGGTATSAAAASRAGGGPDGAGGNRRVRRAAAPPPDCTLCTSEAKLKILTRHLRTSLENGSPSNSHHATAGTTAAPIKPPFFLAVHTAADETTLLATSLLVHDVRAVLDHTRLPVAKLARLVDFLTEHAHSLSLVVESAVVLAQLNFVLRAAEVPQLTKFVSVFDLRVAHAARTGETDAALAQVARAVGVDAALAPEGGGGTAAPDDEQLRGLGDRVVVLSNTFAELRAANALDAPEWAQRSLCALASAGETWQPARLLVFKTPTHTALLLPADEPLPQLESLVDTSVRAVSADAELDRLLELLPAAWRTGLPRAARDDLIDVQLDLGRPPFAFFRRRPKLLLSGERASTVEREHLKSASACLPDGFDADARAGVPGTLHRVSVLRARAGDEPIGLTLRVGRHMFGVASILTDLLLADEQSHRSILLIGPPGCGKTTMGRDIARMLANKRRVIIVDSSNEMGGCGIVPHECIGDARRMPVRNGKAGMSSALLEALQNHTPDVVVIDEISRREEVAGAATARYRGVRLIASAHGSLFGLVRNAALRPLVGDVERVIMSDAMSRGQPGEKLKTVRASEPVFNMVVEMGVVPGDPSTVRIVANAQHAVDCIVSGQPYGAELRWREAGGTILSRSMAVSMT